MKTQNEIQEFEKELKNEIDHPETTKERKAMLRVALDTVQFILR